MGCLQYFLLWAVGLKKGETQTTPAERDCLAQHATGRKRLVEIGTYHGVSTARLRDAMSSEGTLVAVDYYPPGRLGFSADQIIAHSNADASRNGRICWMRMRSAEAAKEYDGQLDFIFIDGDHSRAGIETDWSAWSGRVAPDGIVALHDSIATLENKGMHDSIAFTDSVILKDDSFNKIDSVDSLTVLRRRP